MRNGFGGIGVTRSDPSDVKYNQECIKTFLWLDRQPGCFSLIFDQDSCVDCGYFGVCGNAGDRK